MKSCLCTDGTVMKKYMLAAISTQGEGSISLNLTTPIHYGGQKQFTTESIILDKDHHVVLEAGQRTSCCLELRSSILDFLTLLLCLMYICMACVCVNLETGS